MSIMEQKMNEQIDAGLYERETCYNRIAELESQLKEAKELIQITDDSIDELFDELCLYSSEESLEDAAARNGAKKLRDHCKPNN